MPWILPGLGFFAGFLLVFALNLLLAGVQRARREELQERLRQEQRMQQKERVRASVRSNLLDELAGETSRLSERRPLKERLGVFLEQSGTRVSLKHLIAFSCTLAGGVVCGLYPLTSNVLVASVAGMGMALVPFLSIQFLRKRRLHKLLSQLPDAFDLMARSMRAGQTFMQSMQSVSDEAAAPLSLEFAYCYDQQYLGLSTEAALRDLTRRTGLLEIKIFALAVLVHRQTGGNLSELLEKLSKVIRDRTRVSGLVQSLTAEGRLQAYILLALPPMLFGLLWVLNKGYAQCLLNYPSMLLVTAMLMAAGAMWMNKIVKFDF
jgi:tight adherence protein B